MITKKQTQEIDFLIKYFNGKEDDTKEYLDYVVHGKGVKDNSLFKAKRELDMMVKMWTEDMQKGQLLYFELIEDFEGCQYIQRIVKTIRKNLTPLPSYNGLVDYAKMGYLNSRYGLELN